jgi:hypothetical protein
MALLACALAAAACASRDAAIPEPESIEPHAASADAIRVTANDYVFELSADRVRAGAIDFVVKNTAERDHELVVVRIEDGRYDLPLGGIDAIGGGETRAMRAELRPGRYELVCLIVSLDDGDPASHLALGMRKPFEVTN